MPIKKLISKALINRHGEGRLLTLLFHKVPRKADPFCPDDLDAQQFEQIIAFLAGHFSVLPLEEATKRMQAGTLPARAAAITFDDGYPEWFETAVPLLEQYRLPASFFITTEQFSGIPLWHERISHAVMALPDGELMLREANVGPMPILDGSLATRIQLIRQLQEVLKYRSLEERGVAIAELEACAVKPIRKPGLFLPEHVVQLRDKGFSVGAHTVAHPILARTAPEVARREIAQSREELEAILREPVRIFAYPNGRPNIDYGTEHVQMVKEAGYSLAVATCWGAASKETDVFQLPRFTPWATSAWRIALQLYRNMKVVPETVSAPKRAVVSPNFKQPQGVESKRILMTAFHFPPQAGSSGILRTLNFVKYLPRSGWEPMVLTAHPRAYEETRDDLLKSIPEGTRVIRAQALDAARHLSIRRKYLRLCALPDRWSSWWIGAMRAGKEAIRQHKPDVIWSTYPISTAHLIGASLARWSGLPWVADFRDPMINNNYPTDRLQRRAWKALEARVLRDATLCIFTTERAAEVYRARYPESAERCRVIENGYDEEAFQGVTPVRNGVSENTLLLLHSGIIYPKDRDPGPFFKAVSTLIAAGRIPRERLCIRFRAPHHADEVAALAQTYGLGDVVDVAPPIPYRAAIAEMLAADLLLVFQGSAFNAQIPAKIYEYVRAMRPILALVDPAGDTASQLKKFQGVYFADIRLPEEIEAAMSVWYSKSDDGTGDPSELMKNLDLVRKYSRESHAQNLAKLLHAL